MHKIQNQVLPNKNRKLAAARRYAVRRIPVFPLYGIADGHCECGKADCDRPGKHPRVEGGVKAATTDKKQIDRWWHEHPNSNIGIATGSASGLIAIDVDGKTGRKSFKALELDAAMLGTRTAITGRGRHYLYRPHGEEIANSQNKLGKGVDVRGEGGYIVAPPSEHVSGRRYRWLDDRAPIAPLSAALLSRLRQGASAAAVAAGGTGDIPAGVRNATLTRYAGAMRRVGMLADDIKASLASVNTRRCKPALPSSEISRIAQSVARYAPAESMQTPPKLSGAALYGLAGDVVRVLGPHTEAADTAILLQLLVAVGNAVGRTAHFTVESDAHWPNLYLVLFGETAKARKGTSWGRIKALLGACDRRWSSKHISSGLSSAEGLIFALRDAVDKDPGIKDKRLLVFEPEFAAVLRMLTRTGNTLAATLRAAWDGGDLRTMTKHSPLVATAPHLSIVAHATREELVDELRHTEIWSGFSNRFLWAHVSRSKVLPEGSDVPQAEMKRLSNRIGKALAFGRSRGRMDFSDKARKLWGELYEELSTGVPGSLGAATNRAEAQTRRLATIYAVLDKSTNVKENTSRLLPPCGSTAFLRRAYCSRAIFANSKLPCSNALDNRLRE